MFAIRLPRGRHGGPGSGTFGLKVTKRAVGKTAIPYRSLPVTRLSWSEFSLPPAMPIPTPTKPARAVRIGTRARPLPVIVLPKISVLPCGGSASFAYVFGTIPAPLRSQTESRMTTPVAFVPEYPTAESVAVKFVSVARQLLHSPT